MIFCPDIIGAFFYESELETIAKINTNSNI